MVGFDEAGGAGQPAVGDGTKAYWFRRGSTDALAEHDHWKRLHRAFRRHRGWHLNGFHDAILPADVIIDVNYAQVLLVTDGPAGTRDLDDAAVRCQDGSMDEVPQFYGGSGGFDCHRCRLGRSGSGPLGAASGGPRACGRIPHPGRSATLEIIDALDLPPVRTFSTSEAGSADRRTLAELTGCTVTGVDITPEFCEAATALSEWTGLSDRTRFQVGTPQNDRLLTPSSTPS